MIKLNLLLAVSILGIGALVSCRTSKEVPTGNHLVDFTPIMNATLYGDGQEGFSQGGIVIRNENELENFRTKANSVNETIEGIAADFSKETLLIYVDQVRGNAGHSLEIKTISETERAITVEVQHRSEVPASEVISQPFIMVSILKSEKDIQFSFREENGNL